MFFCDEYHWFIDISLSGNQPVSCSASASVHVTFYVLYIQWPTHKLIKLGHICWQLNIYNVVNRNSAVVCDIGQAPYCSFSCTIVGNIDAKME